jgi:hypothetical protein
MKWEYLFVSCEWTDMWRPRYINQQEQQGWETAPAMDQFARQLGEQGWEMIAFAPVTLVTGNGDASGMTIETNYSAIEMAFKRPHP